MRGELCLRINAAWGGKLVREVKLAAVKGASAGPGLSHETDNRTRSSIPRRHRA